MAITEPVLVEIASVDVNDEYRVELRQHRKLTDYSPEQADQLAEELMHHARRARVLIREHINSDAERIRAGERNY